MSKKRANDPGLQYLQEIGFERIKGKYGLMDRWSHVFGRERAEQLFDQRNKIPDGSTEFYEFKNSDPELSKSFVEAYDGDIIRKACNYIDSHKEFFGKSILEVGCESGYMTGFLAKTFPEARIVSIDRSAAAVRMASKRISSQEASNVEFRVSSLSDVSEHFDTVFCMRTIQENLDDDKRPYKGEPLFAQIHQYSALTEEYTSSLRSCLKDEGTLCVFERVAHDPLMCGWMIDLCRSKCAPDLNTYTEYDCQEVDETSKFQAFICKNGTTELSKKIIELWYKAIDINPEGKHKLTEWNALSYLYDNAGEFIRGVRILNDEKRQVGRFAIFYDKDNPNIYYLQAAGCNIELFSFTPDTKNDVLAHLQASIDQNVSAGLFSQEIDSQEEFLEGHLLTTLD